MLYVAAFISLIFFGLGYLLNKNNAKYLLSGYNTMSESDRAQFDIEGYLVFFNGFHRILGITTFVITVFLYFFNRNYASMFMLCYPLAAYGYLLWKSIDYYKNKKHRMGNTIGAVLMFGLAIGIGYYAWSDFGDSKLIIKSDQIEITGSYGITLNRAEIHTVLMVDHTPEIALKTNGFAAGDFAKGHFRTKEGGSVMLFINKNVSKAIHFKTNTADIYYNTSTEDMGTLHEKIVDWQNL